MLAAAQKYLERRTLSKALDECERVLHSDPSDVRAMLRRADTLAKMDSVEEAAGAYDALGALYARKGFASKAIAAYLQVRELAKKHPQVESQYAHVPERLGELYATCGRISEARVELDAVADGHLAKQRWAEAIAVLEKIVMLDGKHATAQARLGDALLRAGRREEAVLSLTHAYTLLSAAGLRDSALAVLEKLLELAPDPKHAFVAAQLYVSRGREGDGTRALAKLRLCLGAAPRDIDVLLVLSKAFELSGQRSRAVEAVKQAARLAEATCDDVRHAEAMDALAALAPNARVSSAHWTVPPSLRAPRP